jgi:hypothetical protein
MTRSGFKDLEYRTYLDLSFYGLSSREQASAFGVSLPEAQAEAATTPTRSKDF